MNYASPFARRLSGLWSQVGSGNGASLKSFELLPARLFVQPHRRLSHIFGISVNRNASTCLYGASSTSQKIFQGIACISTKVASSKKEHMAVSRKTKRSTITPGSRNSFQSLSPMQLFEIFQAPVNAKNAHEFLAKLQKHRVEGTLEQEVQVPGFTEVHAAQALEWLRTCFPLDEDAAIMMRFEKEDQEAVIKAATYQPQQNNEGREDYGQSQLDLIKQRNLAVAAETQAEEEASKVDNKDIVSGTPAISHPQGRVVLGRRVESAEWVKRYRRKAALSDLLEPPDMTIRARLLPSAIFCVCFIGACVLFAQAYVPPPRAVRIWSDVSPATATILTLVGLNCTAFLLWRIPPLWNFFNRFMLLEPAMPRAVSLLGNTFSHHAVGHLTINMLFLWFVGARLHNEIGRADFLAVYLSSGVFASFVSLAARVVSKNLLQPSLGASGALYGILATYLCLHFKDDFFVPLIPREYSPHLPGWLLLSTTVILELAGLRRGTRGSLDYQSHFGGLVAGVVSYHVLNTQAHRRHLPQELAKKRESS